MSEAPPTVRHRRRRNPKLVDRRQEEDSAPDFRTFVDQAVQGVIIHRNFKPLYANKAFAELFGYAGVKEVMELPLLRELVPADLWPRMEAEYDEMMRGTKKSLIGRSRGICKDGAEIWVSVILQRIDWEGQPAMMLTAFDITQQVESEHHLVKNEQRQRAVLEILPYPIYIARRKDGHILFVNRKSCLLFQQGAGQLLRSKSVDFFVDSKDKESLDRLFDTLSDVRDIEMQMKTSQGRIFTAEMAAIAVDYQGMPAMLVALNDVSQRKELEAELFHQASTDSLTGIINRRYFQNQAEQEVRRSRRFARDMTVMMIDIDHFKPINDTYGHAAGDIIIQGVVKRALECLRQSDSIGRIGGEEFAVLLPETSLDAARDVAERLRAHIEARPFVIGSGVVACTVSIGVAQLSAQDNSIEELLHRADTALYAAKNEGRNRVEVAVTPVRGKEITDDARG